ncbi:MAG: hypothetical protein ACXWRE_06515 [Pseudobdellovibrionaceae bacterium]
MFLKYGKNTFSKILLFTLFSSTPALFAKTQASELEIVAPAYLLHAGDRKILMEDIRQGGISQEIWEKFIMSGSGNFDGLPSFRRGLYGVSPEDLSKISLYGAEQWEKGQENWIMIIHLKPECRQRRFVIENYERIFDNETPVTDPWTLWLQGKGRKSSLSSDTMEFCIEKGYENLWDAGSFYGLNNADPLRRKKTEICGGVVQNFFEEKGAKLVGDPMNGDYADLSSWTIREPSCIDKLTGTPEDLFQGLILGKLNKGIPAELFGEWEKPYNRPWITLLFMVNIFSEAPGFLKADWKKVVRSYMAHTELQYTDQLLENFSDQPHAMRNSQFEVVGYYLLKQTAECAKKKRLPELQGLYKRFADWYFGHTKDCFSKDENDPICRWGEGPGNSSLQDWSHVSSVLSLLRETKNLCSSVR